MCLLDDCEWRIIVFVLVASYHKVLENLRLKYTVRFMDFWDSMTNWL